MTQWVGASVIAPRPHTPIEFEIASEPGTRTGYFHESMFFSDGDAAGWPRRMIRRWRYLEEDAARDDLACAPG
ncbi:MAG TPA: hypothetical protein VJ696_02790 [Rhodanobacteraceae bacterium]|nr:hypothetical protein [Rhodanobacteraceae bacterium]